MKTEIYQALSDENRLRMLNLLFEKELCVCEIETVLQMSQSNVSRHLTRLRRAGLVAARREAQWMYYSVSKRFVEENPLLCEQLKVDFDRDPVLLSDRETLKSYGERPICGV